MKFDVPRDVATIHATLIELSLDIRSGQSRRMLRWHKIVRSHAVNWAIRCVVPNTSDADALSISEDYAFKLLDDGFKVD